MQTQIKKSSIDVKLDGRGGSGRSLNDFPDPESLAKKYDLEYDMKSESAFKADSEAQFLLQLEFAQKQQVLLTKLEAKNTEVERLCVLLEAIEPIPGMDADKYKRLIDNPGNSDNVDFRDSKIVLLAKKCRKLQMAVNKERSISDAQARSLEDFKNDNERLRKEIEMLTISSTTSTFSASRTIRAPQQISPSKGTTPVVDPAELEQTSNQLRKELNASNKTNEDLRRKLEKALDDTKSLSQALAREVGDGVTLEQAVDGGWRGRAQQIILLKSKIKRLESAVGMNSTTGTLQSFATVKSSSTRQNRLDVDSQAENGLAEMSNERKIAVDAIVEERAKLIEDYQKLEAKSQGQKARVRKLEEESQTHRQQLKIVLDKSETDDQLIGALRREVQRLKENSTANARKDDSRLDVAVRQSAINAASSSEAEIARLKRQLAVQSAQLQTQDQVIREIRSKMGGR